MHNGTTRNIENTVPSRSVIYGWQESPSQRYSSFLTWLRTSTVKEEKYGCISPLHLEVGAIGCEMTSLDLQW